MPTSTGYDAICIGSGHNALITAAYLARAGWKVLVLEQNDRPGGLVRTEDLTLPGFHHDLFSSAHPLFLTGPAYAELGAELTERGLHYLNTDLPTGVSMSDGQTAVLSRDMPQNVAELDRLAPGDGAALLELLGAMGPYANDVFGLFAMDLSSAPAQDIIRRLLRTDTGYTDFGALLFATARNVVSSFRSPVSQAMIAPWVMHLGRTPDEVGSGVWVPLVLMALAGGGMAIPQGGSEMLAKALTQLIIDKGGTLRCQARATRIDIRDGKAVAVHTEGGEVYEVRRHVIASVNPDQLYLKLLASADIPTHLKQQAQRFRYGRGCIQIQLALSAPPAWPDPRFQRIGQPHISSGLDDCTLAVAQAAAGLLPEHPTFTVDCPTQHDPSRAPAGKAIMRVQLLEIPCRPRGDAAGQIDIGDGEWTETLKQRFSERVLGILSKHIPNIPDAIIGMHILSPREIAQFSPNLGPGDPYSGAHDLAQSYLFRPLPGQPGHTTAIPNIHMLGAATWPGHGINGGSGYIVAKKLLA